MPINIHISGDTAEEVIGLMRGLTGPGITYVASVEPDIQVIKAAGAQIIPDDKPDHVHAPADYEEPEPETEEAETSAEVDATGTPFDPEIHTGTKKKDGTWRMKKGAVSTSTDDTGETESTPSGDAPTEPAPIDEDDEFAAFRAAEAKVEAADSEATASIPAREWTDADLGTLANQAAQKLAGNVAPIKELIAKFVPEGAVNHSRNIPKDQREEFAKAVEEMAGITFAG